MLAEFQEVFICSAKYKLPKLMVRKCYASKTFLITGNCPLHSYLPEHEEMDEAVKMEKRRH